MRHCVKVTEENETKLLTFVKYENHEGSSPNKSPIQEEGIFSVGSQYGIMKCSTFSGFSIWLKRLFNLSYRLNCCMMMLYSLCDEPDELRAYVVIIKDIRELTQVLYAHHNYTI